MIPVNNDIEVRVGPVQESIDGSYVNDLTFAMDVVEDQDDSGANKITGATNASPVVITTESAHGLETGDIIRVIRVKGNDDANGVFTVTKLSSVTFSLQGSTGSADYVAGGRWYRQLVGYSAVALTHIGGEQGEYVGTIDAECPMVPGQDYRIIVEASDGSVSLEYVDTASVRS